MRLQGLDLLKESRISRVTQIPQKETMKDQRLCSLP